MNSLKSILTPNAFVHSSIIDNINYEIKELVLTRYWRMRVKYDFREYVLSKIDELS